MASLLPGLAGLPPILPPVPGTPGPPAAPKSDSPLGGLSVLAPLLGPAGAAGAAAAAGEAAGAAAATEAKTAGGNPFSAATWENLLHGLLQDLEVYGFMFLLVAIGLYGLFAPQVQTVIKDAGKAAALA